MDGIKLSLWTFLLIFLIIILLAVVIWIVITPIKPVEETNTEQEKAELEEMKARAQVEARNKELVRQWLEETDKGNYEIWDELCSPDYVARFPGFKPLSLAEHKQANRLFYIAFPDFRHTINELIAEGDKVVFRTTLNGTHKGEFMGISPTGKEIEYTAMVIMRFSEGKIIEMRGEADMLGLMQQLGMELKPKEAEK